MVRAELRSMIIAPSNTRLGTKVGEILAKLSGGGNNIIIINGASAVKPDANDKITSAFSNRVP